MGKKRVNGGLVCRAFARNMHVKIKRSEITIEFSMNYLALSVPRTGTKPYFQEKSKEHKCRIIQRFSDLIFSLDFIKKTLFCEKLLIGCLLSQIFFVPL